jgi:hypothetical protein
MMNKKNKINNNHLIDKKKLTTGHGVAKLAKAAIRKYLLSSKVIEI